MIILIDQDNVLADFDGRVASEWARLHPTLPPLTPQYYESFKLVDNLDIHLHEKVRAIYRAPGFFRNLTPLPGAIAAVKHLAELGHEIFICTAPIDNFENCVLEKYLWVEEHLGREWTKRIIMTKDKTVIRGDILIDDNPNITGVAQPTWEQILFTKPYNQKTTNLKRIDSWSNYQDVLKLKEPV